MNPTFFAKPSDFRKWLQRNHQKETQLLVGFYKVSSRKPSMNWSESVDEALCFGWIDGVRKSIDQESYQIRFTQRKPGSTWSLVNIKKADKLVENGLMKTAGLAAFQQRTKSRSGIYSHENEPGQLTEAFEKVFKKDKKAWAYFQVLAPSYRRLSVHWVMAAKQKATQEKRLSQLISDSRANTNRWKDNKYKK